MKPREHLERLDLGAVVQPFLALADVDVAIHDADGRLLAGATLDGGSRAGTSAPLLAHGELVGRIVFAGPGASAPLAAAAAAAIAAALSAVTGPSLTSHEPRETALARTLEEELAQSRRLQRTFVSLQPPAVPGYDIASHYESAREIGGDFFDLFRERRRGHPLSVVVADVTGKGVAAAMLMAFTRPLLHSAIDHARSPAEALERTNSILVHERRTGLFVTALAGRLELGTGRMTVANAGHEPPLFVSGDGAPLGLVLGSGPLLGVFGSLGTPEVVVDLAPGDVIVLYTDGVTDARSVDGERFDERRFFAAVERARSGTAQDVVREIADAVTDFSRGTEPADDVTLVAIGRQRPRRRQPRASHRRAADG